jgi:hypothetical protein
VTLLGGVVTGGYASVQPSRSRAAKMRLPCGPVDEVPRRAAELVLA